MKKTKKVMALLLSVIMILAMSATVFAANITISDKDTGSTYVAYRLLNLTTSATNGKINYSYTLNSKYKNILTTTTGKNTEKDIIDYISKLDQKDIRTFADRIYKAIVGAAISEDETANGKEFTNVDQGYYLIAEKTVTDPKGSYSLVMLDTLGQENITVTTKEDTPTVEKKVKDVNDTDGTTSKWQDSADADVGDELEYKLTGTVSEKIANYETYSYEFVDTMTNLTYVDGSYKVEVDGIDCTDQFNVAWDENTKKLTVTTSDLKKLTNKDSNQLIKITPSTKVVVTYKATLDANAVIGSAGNPNTVYLKYSNNPYGDGTGETPKDKNIVFTYKVVANKVDENKKPLTGAAFELFKHIKNSDGSMAWVSRGVVGATKNVDGTYTADSKKPTTFSWERLDDGEYKIVEVLTPDGYNKIEDQIFTVTAEHDIVSDNPELTRLSGNAADGSIITFTSDKTKGSLTTEIENKSGSLLPSTGGIGTTIFYVVGVVLMLGAGVLLITKRRMSAKH